MEMASAVLSTETMFRAKINKAPTEIDEYIAYLKQHDSTHHCHHAYETPVIVASCSTCEIKGLCPSIMPCICIPCLLKSNHEGHDLKLHISSSATCDCGDSSLWNPNSFCSDHKIKEGENHLTLPKEEVELLKDALYSSISDNVAPYFILSELITVGDSITSIVADAIKEKLNIQHVFLSLIECPAQLAKKIINFFCSLVNNETLRELIGHAYIDVFLNLQEIIAEEITIHSNLDSHVKSLISLFQTGFHYLSPSILGTHPMFTGDGKKLIEWVQNLFEQMNFILSQNYFFLRFTQYSTTFLTWFTNIFITILSNENVKHVVPQCREILFNFMESIEYRGKFSKAPHGTFDDDPDKPNTVLSVVLRTVYDLLDLFNKHNLLDDYPLERYKSFYENSDPIKETEEYGFILDGTTEITISLSLHSAVALFMMKNVKNIKEILMSFCDDIHADFDRFCRHFASPIVSLFAAIPYSFLHLFGGTSIASLSSVVSITDCFSIPKIYAPLFSAVQILLGITNNKDAFISMIADKFGAFNVELPESDKLRVSFLHFLCCLLFDKTMINVDLDEITRITFSNYIKINKQARWNDLQSIFPSAQYSQDLFTYLKKESNQIYSTYTLKNTDHCTPFAPWLMINSVLEFVASCDTIFSLPAPKFNQTEGLDFSPVLTSPIVHDIILIALSSSCSSAKQFSLAIIEHFKQPFAFDILQKIEPLGPLKEAFFKRCNYQQDEDHVENHAPEQKPKKYLDPNCDNLHFKSRAIQDEIMKSFAAQTANFPELEEESETESSDNQIHDTLPDSEMATCSVCNSTDKNSILYFPVLSYRSSLPTEIDVKYCDGDKNAPFKVVIMFQLCQHLIHKECAGSDVFTCPLDMSPKNALFPRLIPCKHLTADRIDSEIKEFLSHVYNTPLYLPSLLSTLCGYITILEMRFRIKAECFYRQVHIILIQNLCEMIKRVIDMEKAVIPEITKELSPFERATLNILNGEEFMHLMPTKTDIQKITFLRRVTILQKMLSANIGEQICIKFKEWLKPTNLSKEFKVKIDNPDIILPKYSLGLPKYYHDLFRLKSLEDAYDFSTTYIFILNTRDVLTVPPIEPYQLMFFQMKHVLMEYGTQVMNNTPFIALHVNGMFATSLFIYSYEFSHCTHLKPIYLDPQGDPNEGINRSCLLSLCEERCNENIDLYLSGEWTSQMNSRSLLEQLM